MEKRPKQEYDMYKNKGVYDHKGRWLSYYYQYKNVIAANADNVLEIGPGNGTTTNFLRTVGFKVTTVDYEQALNPDIVADVLKLPFQDKQFDFCLCCEVLEHLPFEELQDAVKELHRVSKKIYLTVPDQRRVLFSISFKLPFINHRSFQIRVPRIRTKHVFDGFHYWEIGKKDYPLRKVTREIEKTGVKIIKHGTYVDVPLVHYFLLE
jgi:ubiquinone/menaquinone biosynthesis C-methylase UbiE